MMCVPFMMCVHCHIAYKVMSCTPAWIDRMEALIKYCITLLCDYSVTNYWMIDELTIHVQCQCHVWGVRSVAKSRARLSNLCNFTKITPGLHRDYTYL